MGKAKYSYRSKKRKFTGNQFVTSADEVQTIKDVNTASSSKLMEKMELPQTINTDSGLCGNRIFDLNTLITVFSLLCCPLCLEADLTLVEDSKLGLSSNFSLKCKKCNFVSGFSSTKKLNKLNELNTLMVYGLRLIGAGYSAGNKLCSLLNLPFLSKYAFRKQEEKLLLAASISAQQCMNEAALEVRKIKKSRSKVVSCGTSVDGSWQKRGFSSLNGCVTAISIDTGKILDLEAMSSYCRICNKLKSSSGVQNPRTHNCRNHQGSASSMESVGSYRIFERSQMLRNLMYTDYYGDGDSKAYPTVKDIYGTDSVTKLECIGHVQKRVGSRLRKLKSKTKGVGGKGKLTFRFIDKLQNYYGIAVRSNIGKLEEMQSAVIAAFFHTCSSKGNPMHGQCPKGADSWCKFQRAKALKNKYVDKSAGIPTDIMKIIKPSYMELCDRKLLEKCLHGKTQNANESFNGVLWQMIPKQTFVEFKTFQLGAYIALLQFNQGAKGILSVIENLGLTPDHRVVQQFNLIDKRRIHDSKRHSLPEAKLLRKKLRAIRKKKWTNDELQEGPTYKAGEF